jgi:FkbM family methyltransferase
MEYRGRRITWDFLVEKRFGWNRLTRVARILLRMAGACSLSKDLRALWVLHVGRDADGEVKLHPKALGGQRIVLRPSTTDFDTFVSTFLERYHDPPAAAAARIESVLDLGANVGFTAADLAARFPTASVVAVEMDPSNHRQAQKNTFAFGERVRCISAAVWVHEDGVSYITDRNHDAFAVVVGDSTGPVRSVPSLTIDHLINMLPDKRVDFLKMDVEGAETVLLQPEHSAWLARVRSLNVEVHDSTALPRLRDLLVSAGFAVRLSTRHWSALEAWREH